MEAINYELCYICQVSDGLSLIDPSKNTRLKKYPNELETTYRNVLQNINKLDEIGALPECVAINALKTKTDRVDIDSNQAVNTLK